jgi:hypothetical protein
MGEASHLLQSINVEIPKSLMPAPCNIIAVERETFWLGNLKMELEAISAVLDPNKDSALLIPYAKHTSPDQPTCVALIELTNADDRVLQAWDVVDAAESLVFTIFASEHDRANALDFDHRVVTEFDSVGGRSVNFSECVTMAVHVISGAGVEVLALDSLIIAIFGSCETRIRNESHPGVGVCLQIVNVKRGMLWSCSGALLHHYGSGRSNILLVAAGATLRCTTMAAAGVTLCCTTMAAAIATLCYATLARAGVVQTCGMRSAVSSSSSSAWPSMPYFS